MDEKTYTLTLTREQLLGVNYALYEHLEKRKERIVSYGVTKEFRQKTEMLLALRCEIVAMLNKEEQQ